MNQASTVAAAEKSHRQPVSALTLGALGIVFGDIGTSPLYTLRECLRGTAGGVVQTADVYGLLSLIFWSLTMVVTVKYLTFIMRADNHGEGGIFALLAVLPERLQTKQHGRKLSAIAVVVVIGAALLYGDGAITPAISVLSAIEGVTVVSPGLSYLVVPVTCVILIGLFAVQSRGTGAVGAFFGPIMAVWFATIAALGIYQIAQEPAILLALSPHFAVRYFIAHGVAGFLILGSVVLAVTGGEALYADMGHFGARPIRLAWLLLVMPALVLCYFGQGALVLREPVAIDNPFFAMVPNGLATYLLVALSSVATVIASQALISGAFSLTRQAMQLGYFPRVTVRHTAAHTEGQIYIPQMNWLLAVGCLLLVLGFQKSDRLASAYGIAVTGTMMLTSIVYFVVMRQTFKWPLPAAIAILVLFLSFDVPFFLANTVKVLEGGWVPVFIGIGFIAAMLIWNRGRSLVVEEYARRFGSFEEAVPLLKKRVSARVKGVGVYMAANPKQVPAVLVHVVKRMGVLHEHVLLFTVVTESAPTVKDDARLNITDLGDGFYRILAHFGFMEIADVPALLARAAKQIQLEIDPVELTYFVGHESVLATDAGAMGHVAESVYAFLQRNAVSAERHFNIPPQQVVEIGIQMDL